MKNPRTLVSVLALTVLFGLSTTAVGQVGTGCDPGQILTPCSSAIAQAPTPDDMGTPAALATVPGDIDMPRLTEIAANVLQSIWSLF